MMDDDDDAAEGVADGFRRPEVGAHVDVLALGPDQGLVQRVQHHGYRLPRRPELRLEVGNQPDMVFDQVGLPRHDVERDMGDLGDLVVPPQRLDPLLVAVCALERAIDNRTLADAAVVIFPAHG